MPKSSKRRMTRLRFRKNDPAHNLMAATQHWILANGGTAVVLGGVGLMRESEYKYQVCIGALGRAPEKPKSE